MLKTKLFKGFAAVVLLFSLLSIFVGVRTIHQRVIAEAQKRVRLDIGSAWAILNGKLHEVETILKLIASKQLVGDVLASGNWQDPELRSRLERIRVNFGFDFLDLVAVDGRVLARTSPPFAAGDYLSGSAVINAALMGESKACMAVLSRSELEREGEGLADRAFMELHPTPHSRRTPKTEESRGMAMVGAVPVQSGAQVLGVVYGGILVNRNEGLVDEIHDVIYKTESYKGAPLGTATIFLDDSRVATTVRGENGNRAIGTRVSKEVADRVLDNGEAWVGNAFVVKDWYLTAYDPIRDCAGRVVGMLYVGVLRRPFHDDERTLVLSYVFVSLFVMMVGLVLAFIIASRLALPIHRLVEVANKMSRGQKPGVVKICNTCHETDRLIEAFNGMTAALAEREDRLKALNRSYMETLGFVSHELKSPVATIMNYVYLLRQQKLGPLTEKQEKAVKAVDASGHRLVEMVRHYLNLSRIENGEWLAVSSSMSVLDDVVRPLLEELESEFAARHVRLANGLTPEIRVFADRNMVREVFENLISNALKYGREGGVVTLGAKPVGASVQFAVRNEGEGIPPEKVGTLFQKFSRIEEPAGVRREKGTGLGLFITKHIVEAHGGRIEVESCLHEWVEFRFTLPGDRGGTAPDSAG